MPRRGPAAQHSRARTGRTGLLSQSCWGPARTELRAWDPPRARAHAYWSLIRPAGLGGGGGRQSSACRRAQRTRLDRCVPAARGGPRDSAARSGRACQRGGALRPARCCALQPWGVPGSERKSDQLRAAAMHATVRGPRRLGPAGAAQAPLLAGATQQKLPSTHTLLLTGQGLL